MTTIETRIAGIMLSVIARIFPDATIRERIDTSALAKLSRLGTNLFVNLSKLDLVRSNEDGSAMPRSSPE
jgi:hypothetical protein